MDKALLRWLARLSLSTSARPTRHGLHDGRVVGEVLARHFGELNERMLSHGLGQKERRANWDLIRRTVARHSVPVPPAALAKAGEDDGSAAVAVLEALFAALSGQEPQRQRPVQQPTVVQEPRPPPVETAQPQRHGDFVEETLRLVEDQRIDLDAFVPDDALRLEFGTDVEITAPRENVGLYAEEEPEQSRTAQHVERPQTLSTTARPGRMTMDGILCDVLASVFQRTSQGQYFLRSVPDGAGLLQSFVALSSPAFRLGDVFDLVALNDQVLMDIALQLSPRTTAMCELVLADVHEYGVLIGTFLPLLTRLYASSHPDRAAMAWDQLHPLALIDDEPTKPFPSLFRILVAVTQKVAVPALVGKLWRFGLKPLVKSVEREQYAAPVALHLALHLLARDAIDARRGGSVDGLVLELSKAFETPRTAMVLLAATLNAVARETPYVSIGEGGRRAVRDLAVLNMMREGQCTAGAYCLLSAAGRIDRDVLMGMGRFVSVRGGCNVLLTGCTLLFEMGELGRVAEIAQMQDSPFVCCLLFLMLLSVPLSPETVRIALSLLLRAAPDDADRWLAAAFGPVRGDSYLLEPRSFDPLGIPDTAASYVARLCDGEPVVGPNDFFSRCVDTLAEQLTRLEVCHLLVLRKLCAYVEDDVFEPFMKLFELLLVALADAEAEETAHGLALDMLRACSPEQVQAARDRLEDYRPTAPVIAMKMQFNKLLKSL